MLLVEDLMASPNPKALSPEHVYLLYLQDDKPSKRWYPTDISKYTFPDSFIPHLSTAWSQYIIWTYPPSQIWSFFYIPFLGEWRHHLPSHPSQKPTIHPWRPITAPTYSMLPNPPKSAVSPTWPRLHSIPTLTVFIPPQSLNNHWGLARTDSWCRHDWT